MSKNVKKRRKTEIQKKLKRKREREKGAEEINTDMTERSKETNRCKTPYKYN